MVTAWVKALETYRAATSGGCMQEKVKESARSMVCLFVFACVSLYKAADGNARVFKSQGTKTKLDFLKHC